MSFQSLAHQSIFSSFQPTPLNFLRSTKKTGCTFRNLPRYASVATELRQETLSNHSLPALSLPVREKEAYFLMLLRTQELHSEVKQKNRATYVTQESASPARTSSGTTFAGRDGALL